MSGPIARIVAQIIIVGGQFATRAVIDAWRQAAANAKKGGGAAGTVINGKAKISLEESRKILGLKDHTDVKAVAEKYSRLFKANEQGGSFYLQSKVFRAKERIEAELGTPIKIDDDPAVPKKEPAQVDSGEKETKKNK